MCNVDENIVEQLDFCPETKTIIENEWGKNTVANVA